MSHWASDKRFKQIINFLSHLFFLFRIFFFDIVKLLCKQNKCFCWWQYLNFGFCNIPLPLQALNHQNLLDLFFPLSLKSTSTPPLESGIKLGTQIKMHQIKTSTQLIKTSTKKTRLELIRIRLSKSSWIK